MSTPWTSVTLEYGARSAGVPRGASIVTQSWLGSSGFSPSHQDGSPREVTRQYANCSADGAMSLYQGSSRPFQKAIALPPGSSVSVLTRFASSESSAEPGSACEYPLRFGHV